ncbi:MAG: hypothetical protein ACKOC8_10755 [Pirellulales bacterium]
MTPSHARPSWSLADLVATLHAGDLTATLDLRQPSLGIAAESPGHVDRLLGIGLAATPLPPVDHWQRAADTVAVYETADRRRLRATVMWRADTPSPGIASWEAIVSAQTALLESDATLSVEGRIEATDVLVNDEGAWRPLDRGAPAPAAATAVLVRRAAAAGRATSVLVAVHPQDRRGIDLRHDGGHALVSCPLFSAALEKGVLLRSRVLAAIGPAAGDETWATRVAADFAASPPPLTT